MSLSSIPDKKTPQDDLEILRMALGNTAACLGDALATYNRIAGKNVFINAAPQVPAQAGEVDPTPATPAVAAPYSTVSPCFDHNVVACEVCKAEDWLCGAQHSRENLLARSSATKETDADGRPFGSALAMAVLQSNEYRMLDDLARAECDELISRWRDWLKPSASTDGENHG